MDIWWIFSGYVVPSVHTPPPDPALHIRNHARDLVGWRQLQTPKSIFSIPSLSRLEDPSNDPIEKFRWLDPYTLLIQTR